ncbi:MAG: ATP-binding cassette domain-containing protein [Firmicutes bacterium]|nr:ATP-binding cassette domain-containing protein [Bacillota bacterium]
MNNNNENKTPILEIKNLKKYFDVGGGRKLHAVDDVTFTLNAGTTVGVVGESGCGKTTLGRTILRLLEPTSGEIKFNGVNIEGLNEKSMRKYREEMQIIFQDPYSSLNPRKTVFESIATPLKVNKYGSKEEISKRVKEVMEICGIADRLAESYPHELDGGRRQRICVARALALQPKFIVCDEPVSALDVSIQAQILNLLMDLQDDMDLTYMFITHDLSVVKHISDEIMVMYLGSCVEKAPSDELFANPRHPYTKALLSAIPIPDISSRKRKVEVVKGELSSPIDPAPGCRFAPRCPHCTPACMGQDMALEEVSPNHFVSCIHVHDGTL